MLTPETLDRLESQAAKQIGPVMTTPIAVNPGDLRELIVCYRQHGHVPNTDKDSTT